MSEIRENHRVVDYIFLPIDILIAEFSSANGITLSYGDLGPWDGPGYQLGWVNPQGHMCMMTLVWSGTPNDNKFSLTAVCWGVSDMLGRDTWSVPIGEAIERLPGKLSEAKVWADQL
jgi:hypothetical protein